MNKRTWDDKLPEEKIADFLAYQRAITDPDVLPWKIPDIRDKLEGYEWYKYIKRLDKWLIEEIDDFIKINPAIEDEDRQPLEKWWWYLHKIASGNYPKELLPDYLQKVYKAKS